MRLRRDTSLYWRIFVSYLLVMAVVSVTLFVMSELFRAILLERHLQSMGLSLHDNPPGTNEMLLDLTDAYRRAFSQSLLWGLLASTFLASVLSLFISRQIVSPLRRMQRASRRIAAGLYRERLDVEAPGEIGDLAGSFNAMATALQQTEAKRVELVGNVAHEFRTPLSGLRGNLEGLQDGLFSLDDETLDVSLHQVARLERLVEDLSLLSRVEAGREIVQSKRIDLFPVLQATTQALQPQYRAKGVRLSVCGTTDRLEAHADPQRTGQVLSNLLANALRHTPAGGEVVLSAGTEDDNRIVVRVQDTGEGIPAEALSHIFQRFYRVDPSRRSQDGSGSGIGLTIARHFVEAQGGMMGVESQLGKGSLFWFTLPAP